MSMRDGLLDAFPLIELAYLIGLSDGEDSYHSTPPYLSMVQVLFNLSFLMRGNISPENRVPGQDVIR